MGIFSQLEKLINEHGSAAIMKERLELVKDQYAALEKQAAGAEETAKRLQAANDRLTREVAALHARLDTLQEAPAGRPLLEGLREQVLLLVAQNEGIRDEGVAGALQIGKQLASYHLGELRKAHLVSMQPYAGSDFTGDASYNEWYLQHEGRAYLAERGLLE